MTEYSKIGFLHSLVEYRRTADIYANSYFCECNSENASQIEYYSTNYIYITLDKFQVYSEYFIYISCI